MASINTGQFGKAVAPGMLKYFEDVYGTTATKKEYADWSRATISTAVPSYTGLGTPATPYIPTGTGDYEPYPVGGEFVANESELDHYGIHIRLVKQRTDSNVAVYTSFCGAMQVTTAANNEQDVIKAVIEAVEVVQKRFPEHRVMVEAIWEREKREKNDCPF